MTADTLPGLVTPQLGIIGSRQLVCVQTFNIARLTSHPVGLIPGQFIAVTGRGPKDSNESGKTSFLASVSLLLGDPEWHAGDTGAANVANLLFDPITAGDAITAHAASEGYIVGVFADPDSAAVSAHTVWLKISSRAPHVQVRHAAGVQLVVARDDRERHEIAPTQFQSLVGQPLGGAEYAGILYGRSPRVLAYVATRGKVRSRPSLLKLDAGTFTPEQIGDTLLSVTGRAVLFENDAEIRRRLAATQARLVEAIDDDKAKTAREEAIRQQVKARNNMRLEASGAVALWRSFRARCVLDTYARAASAKMPLAIAEAELSDQLRLVRNQEARHSLLRDVSALRRDAGAKAVTLEKADAEHDLAVAADTRLADKLAVLETALSEARSTAAGYDLHPDGDAESAAAHLKTSTDELTHIQAAKGRADSGVTDAAQALSQARDGQAGLAGEHLRTLAREGITARGLAEATRLAPESRASWEARIAPWRDAICVVHDDLARVLGLLQDSPGAIVISPDLSTVATNGAAQTGQAAWPSGILEAPGEALTLLSALAEQRAGTAPVPHAFNHKTGVYTVGGFDDPIVGKDDICAYFEKRLHLAFEEQSELSRKVARQEIAVELAKDAFARAQAAEAIRALQPQVAAATDSLATHRNVNLPRLRKARDAARDQDAAAKQVIANRKTELNRLASEIGSARREIEARQAEVGRLRVASHPDDDVLAAWSSGITQALVQLGWPAESLKSALYTRLVDEAPPPPQSPDEPLMERRAATALARAAYANLTALVAVFDQDSEGVGAPDADLVATVSSYRHSQGSGEEDRSGSLFETTMGAIETWLSSSADRDNIAEEQIEQQQTKRRRENEFVATQVQQLTEELTATQQAITQRAQTRLDAISTALNQLNRAAGGLGADLEYVITPPGTPKDDWICHVTPRWRRNTAGRLLSYDTVTNTAQEKLFAIHLVLATLLAAPEPRGRVLILDELGDSLGVEHRRDVLGAIAAITTDHGLTVLGTCQDIIMIEARSFCGEILYFHYPSKSEALNRPTRMFGYDSAGQRVKLTADALLTGRSSV